MSSPSSKLHPQSCNFNPKDGCVCVLALSYLRLFATPWTVACQALLSMEFSRQEYWSGLPFPSPGKMVFSSVQSLSRVQLFATPWTAKMVLRVLKVWHWPWCFGDKILSGLSKTLAGGLRGPCEWERKRQVGSWGHIWFRDRIIHWEQT